MNSRPFAETLVDVLLQFCWNLSGSSFWKGFSLPQKKPAMTLTFFFLLHDYPSALGSRLDGVNINHRIADGQRNTLQVPNAAEVISKDAETHIVAGMAKSALSQIHGVPPIFVQKKVPDLRGTRPLEKQSGYQTEHFKTQHDSCRYRRCFMAKLCAWL